MQCLTRTVWILVHTPQAASQRDLYSRSFAATNPSVSLWSLGSHGFDCVQMLLCSANVIHVQIVRFGVGTPKSHWPLIELLNPICKGEELAHLSQQDFYLGWVKLRMYTRVTQRVSDLTQAGNTGHLEPGGSGALSDDDSPCLLHGYRDGFRKKCVCSGCGEHAWPSDICSILTNAWSFVWMMKCKYWGFLNYDLENELML